MLQTVINPNMEDLPRRETEWLTSTRQVFLYFPFIRIVGLCFVYSRLTLRLSYTHCKPATLSHIHSNTPTLQHLPLQHPQLIRMVSSIMTISELFLFTNIYSNTLVHSSPHLPVYCMGRWVRLHCFFKWEY